MGGICSFENVFFFQAEDGIRDVESSRGLGDVYNGQARHPARSPELAIGHLVPCHLLRSLILGRVRRRFGLAGLEQRSTGHPDQARGLNESTTTQGAIGGLSPTHI